MKEKKKKLREAEWARVFELRCRSKRGDSLSEKEHELCVKAFEQDEKRYSNMEKDVFEATKPFGAQ